MTQDSPTPPHRPPLLPCEDRTRWWQMVYKPFVEEGSRIWCTKYILLWNWGIGLRMFELKSQPWYLLTLCYLGEKFSPLGVYIFIYKVGLSNIELLWKLNKIIHLKSVLHKNNSIIRSWCYTQGILPVVEKTLFLLSRIL